MIYPPTSSPPALHTAPSLLLLFLSYQSVATTFLFLTFPSRPAPSSPVPSLPCPPTIHPPTFPRGTSSLLPRIFSFCSVSLISGMRSRATWVLFTTGRNHRGEETVIFLVDEARSLSPEVYIFINKKTCLVMMSNGCIRGEYGSLMGQSGPFGI